MSLNKFPCTQQELYAVCISGWNNCLRLIDKFAAFKPRYTKEFPQQKLSEVEAAKALPSKDIRNSAKEGRRANLKKHVLSCTELWKKLEAYIEDAWKGDDLKRMLKEAGSSFFKSAANFNWESCQGLMDHGAKFIDVHLPELQANNNMPVNFAAEFKTANDDFRKLFALYLASPAESSEATRAKLDANNALYADLSRMLKDGRRVFKGDPVMYEQFVFENILQKASGHDGAGIKGNIGNGLVPFSQITGLQMFLQENGDEAYINDDGTYRFSQLAAGTYTMLVKAPGYKEQTIPNILVNTGSFTLQNVVLEKV